MKQRAVVCAVALFAAGACTSSKQVSTASSSTSVTKSICTRRPATASELKDAQRAPRGTQGSDFIEIMTLKSVPLEASPALFLSLIRRLAPYQVGAIPYRDLPGLEVYAKSKLKDEDLCEIATKAKDRGGTSFMVIQDSVEQPYVLELSSTSKLSVNDETIGASAVEIQYDGRPRNLERFAIIKDEDYRIVLAAQERSIAKCMANRGFDYKQTEFLPSNSKETIYPSDIELKAKGYSWRVQRTAVDVGNAASAPPTTTKLYREAIEGTQTAEGCGDASLKILNQSPYLAVQQQFFDADQAIIEAINSDGKWLNVLGKWKTCMAAVGYKYESSDDAERSQDKTTAIADYRCRRSEQYEEVRVELGKVLTAQWLERHPEAVKELEARLETLVSDAKKILA